MQRTKRSKKKNLKPPHIVTIPSGRRTPLVDLWDMANNVKVAEKVKAGPERNMTTIIQDYRQKVKYGNNGGKHRRRRKRRIKRTR